MSDLISRQAMIDAMRRHRALFCKNRIEFMALPKDEKARVDEIDNCISDLVNAPDAELEVFEFCASGENPCKEYDQEKHCCHRWTKVIRKTVEDVKNNQWIPVSEALPKEDIDVLLQFPHTMAVGYQENGFWNIVNCDDLYSGLDKADAKPIAWMSLPEPWRGE